MSRDGSRWRRARDGRDEGGQPALHLGERHALAGGVPHRWEDEE